MYSQFRGRGRTKKEKAGKTKLTNSQRQLRAAKKQIVQLFPCLGSKLFTVTGKNIYGPFSSFKRRSV